jgi:peptidoglycan/LPS O-acetylase OafA/YrhL
MNSPNGGSPTTRLASIDALRGVAALGVVLYHAVLQTTNAVPHNLFQWPVKGVVFLSSFGYIGVFLFFVISGFCIHLRWARAEAAGQTRRIDFGSFWGRRLRRLYPPYLVALALFLLLTAATAGIDVTQFFVYDVVMHLLMLHNLDPHTCYSINGVFWTLAIEEQLYLAYFVLLFLRKKWGWGTTLVICVVVRLGWFFLAHFIWAYSGVGIPVPESAASHWFTWTLGAMAVEASYGLMKLPRWCSSVWLGSIAVVSASAISTVLPEIQKDTWIHNGAWLVLHPLWGFGFFALLNRAVAWEQSKSEATRKVLPRLVAAAATLGVFSYSLYLTHELVIMQSWRFVTSLPPILNTLLVVTPATVVFAWVFFNWCEKPYLAKRRKEEGQLKPLKPESAEEIFRPEAEALAES